MIGWKFQVPFVYIVSHLFIAFAKAQTVTLPADCPQNLEGLYKNCVVTQGAGYWAYSQIEFGKVALGKSGKFEYNLKLVYGDQQGLPDDAQIYDLETFVVDDENSYFLEGSKVTVKSYCQDGALVADSISEPIPGHMTSSDDSTRVAVTLDANGNLFMASFAGHGTVIDPNPIQTVSCYK